MNARRHWAYGLNRAELRPFYLRMAPDVPTAHERRFAQTMVRLTPIASAVAIAIEIATVVWVWHDKRAVLISGGIFVAAIGVNATLTYFLMRRWGAGRAELVRMVFSIFTAALANHLIGWPAPTWIWLPYQGLVDDGHHKLNWTILISYCTVMDVLAIHDGVSWMRPVFFTLVAVMARVFSDARLRVLRDMFDAVEEANAQLKAQIAASAKMENELRQAQKLEAVGLLASGVAHEINTPTQFVSDSVQFVDEAFGEVMQVVEAYREKVPSADVAMIEANTDMAFLEVEVPKAITLMRTGLGRITKIVRSMRQIAHPDRVELQPLDITEAVTTAATLATSECKLVADVVTRLGKVPVVMCHASEIVQVILNLVVNAAHAIGETGRHGCITLETRVSGEDVIISVADTGAGIPAGVQEHIFDPFFTTKAVGRGTGQGLAIARTIVKRHGGTLTFETSHSGTTFHVTLPIKGAPASGRESVAVQLRSA